MDVIKLLRNVKSLNDYVSITQVIEKNISYLKVQFSLTTVLALKNTRSLEVEYFQKYNQGGAATIMFEILLRLPPSKSWSVIGKDLVMLTQYWLFALRNHLILNTVHWWNFLSLILNFIQQLYLKHKSIVTWLVEKTGECLLHLATRSEPSTEQVYQILQCFNKYCGLATRELRYAIKNKYEIYLILYTIIGVLQACVLCKFELIERHTEMLLVCEDACLQFTILETLVRWLLPRQDMGVREEAAARWFPSTLFTNEAAQVFVERSWLNFFRDARSFINAINESNDRIVSVLCEKFFVGNVPIVNGTREHWLDLNCGSSSLSLVLESTLYRALKVAKPNASICAALIITENNTETAKLFSGPRGLLLSLKIIEPMQMFASKVLENNYGVKIIISSKSNVQRVDTAMRIIFDKKYQLLSDTDSSLEALELAQKSDRGDSSRFIEYISEEDTRFSNTPEILRRKLLEQRALASRQSPSSVSTSSLVLLRETLKAFPDCQFDKEVERVSARPQLQSVSEVTETEERQSHSSVSTAKLDLNAAGPSTTSSQSQVSSKKLDEPENIETRKGGNLTNIISPNKTIAPANITDLLAQEALQYSRPEDSRSTHDQNTYRTYSATKTRSRRCDKREYNHKPTLVCDATTDESSTAFVENTPAVHVKTTNRITATRREKDTNKDSKDSGFGPQAFDNKTIETFFSQHCSENKHGDLIISPTLARKLNESTSASSESFTLCPPVNTDTFLNFNYLEVVECLNSVIDKVCEDIDKHLEYSSQKVDQHNKSDKDTIEAGFRKVPLEEVTNVLEKDKKKSDQKGNRKNKLGQGIKLKFKNTKVTRNNAKRDNKVDLKSVEKNTPITKIVSDKTSNNRACVQSEGKLPDVQLETPVNKRKRKLYSPKDDDLINAKVGIHVSETEEDNSVLTECKTVHMSPVSNATPYKDLEKLRKNATKRQLRNRKSEVLSPKTAKTNRMFDELQNTENNEEKIVLVDKKSGDKFDAYNFIGSSDDDEDFKTKTAVTRNPKKKTPTPGRNKPKNVSPSTDSNKDKQTIAKRTRSKSKQQMSKTSVIPKPTEELVDQRMRENTEVLNTSLIMESRKEELNIELEPSHKKPRMEIVPDDKECEIATFPVKKTEKRKKKTTQRTKGRGTNKLVIANKPDDDTKTISPLPGLEIETAQKTAEVDNSIHMLEKFDVKYEGHLDVLDLTQHLLLEPKQANINSPPKLNITDEFNKAAVNTKKRSKSELNNIIIRPKLHRSERSSTCSTDVSSNKNLVVVVDKLDIHSAKSILTTGGSPITAHGVYDECPPQMNEIRRRIEPRSLETEDFSDDVIEYYNKLTDDLTTDSLRRRYKSQKNAKTPSFLTRRSYNSQETEHLKSPRDHTRRSSDTQESVNSDKSKSLSDTSPLKHSKIVIQRSPTVCITRLSQKEIDRYISLRNCVSPNSQSDVAIRRSKDGDINENNARKVRKSAISPISLKDFNIKTKSVSYADENLSKSEDTSVVLEKPCFDSHRYNLRNYGIRLNGENKSAASGVHKKDNIEEREKPVIRNISLATNDVQPSTSSVDNWLFRNERREQISTEDATVKEVLSIVQEKLDTTLREIHFNTRKSLIRMLAQIYNEMNKTSEECATEFEQMLADSVSTFVGIINGNFSKFQRTFQEKNGKVIAEFKEITRNILVDEARKKRDFVELLKEDISVALQRITRRDDGDDENDD